jgi:hypothetical protein
MKIFTIAAVVVIGLLNCYTASAQVNAPPAPIIEVVPQIVVPGYRWQSGYWIWNGYQYVWVRGHLVIGSPDMVWIPPFWTLQGGMWHQYSGHWSHRR